MTASYLFLCNANPEEGHGHFFRCFELAKHLSNASFRGDLSDFAIDLLISNNISYEKINKEDTFSLNNFNHNSLYILDSYLPKIDFYHSLRKLNIKWGVFDDFNYLDFSGALFVINFRVDADKFTTYKSQFKFLSPKFMPINDSFSIIRNQKNIIKDNIENILLFLGTVDFHKISIPLGQFLQDHLDIHLNIITQDVSEITSQENMTLYPMGEHIHSLLESSDLAITGGGRFKYETAFSLKPSLTISQTVDQHDDTVIFAQNGLTVDLGLTKNIKYQDVVTSIQQLDKKELRIKMSENCLKIFPSNPSQKLAKEIESLAFKYL